jgi:folate-binding protein YgfZ
MRVLAVLIALWLPMAALAEGFLSPRDAGVPRWLGMNLTELRDYQPQRPFIDVMKNARPWIAHRNGQWGGYEEADLRAMGALDAHGWPRFVPEDASALASLMLVDLHPDAGGVAGNYRVTWSGRADVQITPTDLHLHRGTGDIPSDALLDPRHPALGWRAYRDGAQSEDPTDWPAIYVEHMIPQTGVELTADSFILEMGFERINGVDFRKGCYVGQEVTARMKHKTELRKGLAKVQVAGDAHTGAAITAQGKPAGTLHTRAGDAALAYLRFDRAQGEMTAQDATLTRLA